MADDDDVRGAPGPEELFAPTGPVRSSFTPAPNDAESLKAAAELFNDDAIAAALSAELSRIASGPIPIQRPPVQPSVPEPVAQAEPVAEVAPPAEPVAPVAPEPEPVAEAAPELAPEPAAIPEPVATPEPVSEVPSAPQGPPDWATGLFGQPTPQPESAVAAPITDPFAPSEPSFAPSSGPFPPPGDSAPSPDSAESTASETLRALYAAAPAPTVPAADAPPPPGYESPIAAEPEQPAAPESQTLSAIEQLQAQLDERDRESREYAAWESSMLEVGTPEALAAVDQARAERTGVPSAPAAAPPAPAEEPAASFAPPVEEPAVSFAPPVEEPAASFAPPVEEPAAFLPPPADEPAAFLPPPAEEPAAFTAPPAEEPAAFLPPPAEEPAAFLAPPAEEPAAFLAPPAEEPASFVAPPVEEPVTFLAPPAEEPVPFFPPPAEEPAASFAPPVDEPEPFTAPAAEEPAAPPPVEDNPFDIFAASIDHQNEAAVPPSIVPTAFPGFGPPTDSTTTDFSAPADPRELSFDSSPIPDAPVFLEPAPAASAPAPSVPSAPGPPSWNIDEPASVPTVAAVPEPAPIIEPASAQPTAEEFAAAEPTAEEREAAGAPPALVEPPAPDGVADLWRTASLPDDTSASAAPAVPEATPVPEAVQPVEQPTPTPVVESAPSLSDLPAPDFSAPTVPSASDLEAAPPPVAPPSGFDDLLAGGGQPDPQPPGAAFVTGDPNPFTEPEIDAATGDRRPFGEGVERDDAVDPSDSIFGAPREPVSVNTAGVAVAPQYVVVESLPISVIRPAEEPALVLVAPRISPAEPVGLEPTPLEQRVGRAARLFWLWFAANSSIAAIVFGTIIFALGVSLRQAVVATLAGVALSFVPLGLGTLAGKRSGQPTMVISRATFGVVGNILPALIALFSRLFWAAGLLWVLGAGTADILTGAQLTDGFTVGQLTIIIMVIGFVVVMVIAYFGYALMAIVQLVISVISGIAIAGFIALTVKYVDFTAALSTPDGPWILVVTGAVLVFSFVGLAWANSSADVARYQRVGSSGAASMLWATFGVALPSFVLIAYGALLAASNATLADNIAADPLDSLGRLLPVWYPGPLLAATGLSLLSGIVLAIYSGGFALQAAGLRLRRSFSTLITGVLMVLIAIIMSNALTDFSQLFRDFATTVAVPVAAWAGLFGAEIMMRKRRFDSQSLLNRGGVYEDARWGNLIALVVISAVSYGFLTATMPGLTWEGYLFGAFGVPLNGQLAGTDLGVLVALLLGLLFPLLAGRSGIRAQEKAVRVPE